MSVGHETFVHKKRQRLVCEAKEATCLGCSMQFMSTEAFCASSGCFHFEAECVYGGCVPIEVCFSLSFVSAGSIALIFFQTCEVLFLT